jgi:FdhD protein
MSLSEYYNIHGYEFSKNSINPINISLSSEYIFTVSINGSPYAEIACSGSGMEDFAIGHLLSNNIIKTKKDILNIIINEDSKEINIITDTNEEMLERLLSVKFIASGCAQAGKVRNTATVNTSLPEISATVIISSLHALLHHTQHYNLTHGAHSSAIYSVKGEMTAYFEDIGRHNAVDKAIGFALRNEIDLKDKMVVSTGRLSSEIVHKSINAGIPAIITRSSTTTLGYELAVKHNVILVGRVKRTGFVIYNGKDSIRCA